MASAQELFEEKCSPEPNSGCWLWDASSLPAGYGLFRLNGRTQYAHRVSYTMFKGPIAAGLCVCHKCDNPACVNPDHLFVGTQAENLRDMTNKGRRRTRPVQGAAHGRSKLTDDDVRAIRSDGRLRREIANDYGVGMTTVANIIHRRSWRHI